MAFSCNGSHRCIALRAFVLSVLICLSVHAPTGSAFYIPGVAPSEYGGGEKIGIRVRNKSTIMYSYKSCVLCVILINAQYK